jgi:glutathione S-transferase
MEDPVLTFYHAPNSRSTAVATLIRELGAADRIETRIVCIPRADGTGHPDAANPHPEKKVPVLVHDGHVITERGAILLHLCALFPQGGLAPAPGTAEWGSLATWMTWYQGVLEPVLILSRAGLTHPWLQSTFRGPDAVAARLHDALSRGPWLMGDSYSAADLLLHSPFAWFEDATPDDPLIRDWVDRCKRRPARLAQLAEDTALMAKAA